jgi:hypothetical protein
LGQVVIKHNSITIITALNTPAICGLFIAYRIVGKEREQERKLCLQECQTRSGNFDNVGAIRQVALVVTQKYQRYLIFRLMGIANIAVILGL